MTHRRRGCPPPAEAIEIRAGGAGGVIPPNATLIMEVELIAVNGVEASHATAYSEGFEQSGLNALTQSAVSDTSIEALESSPEVGQTLSNDTSLIDVFSEGYWGDSKLSVENRMRDALINDSLNSVTPKSGSNDDDNMNGQAGTDVMLGLNGSDSIHGNGGNDFLFGDGGNDYMAGGNGNDWLFGGQDDDYIIGGDGNDFIAGGEGTNLLHGGDGSDLFVLDSRGVAVIDDFTLGEDKIYLGGVNNLQFGSHAGPATLIDGDSGNVVAVVNNINQDQLQELSDHVFI